MPSFTHTLLHTERLTLRWLEESDTAALFAMYSDPEVLRYWSSAPWTEMAQADDSIAQSLAGYCNGSDLRFGITLREGGALIGTCALYRFYPMNRRADIGYLLAKEYWGHGYMGEALTAMLDYSFDALDLNRLEADIDPRNDASARTLERLRFQREGYMRERWIVNGEVCDTAFYGLLRSDWKAP
ncbi:MAG: GNAT family N-acetyltransferase [Pseudomonadota bacterium]